MIRGSIAINIFRSPKDILVILYAYNVWQRCLLDFMNPTLYASSYHLRPVFSYKLHAGCQMHNALLNSQDAKSSQQSTSTTQKRICTFTGCEFHITPSIYPSPTTTVHPLQNQHLPIPSFPYNPLTPSVRPRTQPRVPGTATTAGDRMSYVSFLHIPHIQYRTYATTYLRMKLLSTVSN